MKKSILSIAVVAAMFSASLFVVSCGSKNKSEQKEQLKEQQLNEGDSSMETSYACPMHPEVTGKQGDTCSKCGMALEIVLNE